MGTHLSISQAKLAGGLHVAQTCGFIVLVTVCGFAQSSKPPAQADLPIRQTTQLEATKKEQADNEFGEAFALVDLGTRKSLEASIPKFAEARRLYSELGDKRSEAYTLNEIIYVYANLAEYAKALDYCNQALPLFRSLHDIKGEATTLNHAGGIYLDQNDNSKALESFMRALPLRRAAGDAVGEGVTLNNIG